ncbi:hypothetical protein [Leptolyngbya sp. 7M]|uniref:hypothetical protein n=1 Tax=Leptolyngbya sp. 7M TaxID=2812896 RepID=UPI001B8D2A23|nr:hypothetical protein [Leptolyngbya sp. 7M]QYO64643.1 hypothetical protein JVX88_34330 [Leptolyngbya sp. 7M]
MLIFEEYFQDNQHNWSSRSSDECKLGVETNHYVFEHKRSGNSWWVAWNSADFFYNKPDFRIHVVLEKVTGANHGFGFVWGLVDTHNFFKFVIADNGHYRIAKCENGIFKDLVVWKRSHTIQYPNAINILELRRNQDSVEFYINSTRVETLEAELVTRVDDRKFGFIVFDKIKIKVHSLSSSRCVGGLIRRCLTLRGSARHTPGIARTGRPAHATESLIESTPEHACSAPGAQAMRAPGDAPVRSCATEDQTTNRPPQALIGPGKKPISRKEYQDPREALRRPP